MYGENIKSIRIEQGLTQKQVAEITKLPQTTISWIEMNKGIENIEQCIKLADCFKITLDELVGREFEHYSTQSIQINHGNNNTQNNYFKK